MALAAKVYEAFRDDTEKAKVLSDVIGELEVRISPLKDVATKGDIEVTRLTLQKEIEQVKANIIKWVAGLLIIQTGVIVSIITLFK